MGILISSLLFFTPSPSPHFQLIDTSQADSCIAALRVAPFIYWNGCGQLILAVYTAGRALDHTGVMFKLEIIVVI